nr:MAG TPA: hypothetical protein [Caudoviricetes sp.]
MISAGKCEKTLKTGHFLRFYSLVIKMENNG